MNEIVNRYAVNDEIEYQVVNLGDEGFGVKRNDDESYYETYDRLEDAQSAAQQLANELRELFA